MTIRNLLVPLAGEARDDAALAAAGMLARRYDAHVTALYVEGDIAMSVAMLAAEPGGYVAPEVIDAMEERSRQSRARAEQHFADWQKASGLPEVKQPPAKPAAGAALLIERGDAAESIQHHALAADLVLLARGADDQLGPDLEIEAALFEAGRPALLLPPGAGAALRLDAPVCLAWNGSPQAARALAYAEPLLAGRSAVTVLHGAGMSEDRAVAFLAWHGIAAKTHAIPEQGDTGQLIEQAASAQTCGLLVMGAYSHARAREFIMGGVTRHMLHHAPFPLLLAH